MHLFKRMPCVQLLAETRGYPNPSDDYPMWELGAELHPLEEQQVLPTTHLPLQPCSYSLLLRAHLTNISTTTVLSFCLSPWHFVWNTFSSHHFLCTHVSISLYTIIWLYFFPCVLQFHSSAVLCLALVPGHLKKETLLLDFTGIYAEMDPHTG